MIGRFGTAAQLGIYNRAFMLASLPTYQVHHGIAKVLFPVLSSGRSDLAAFAQTLEAASQNAIKLVVPLGIGMALTAPELVSVVLGEGWLEAIPVFAILAPALAFNLLSTFPGQALDALGRLRWKAFVQAGYVVLLGSGLIITAVNVVDLRAITVVIAIAIGSRTVAMYALIFQTDAVPRSFLANSLRTATLSTGVACAAFAPVIALLRSQDTSSLLTLTVAIATGGLVLIALFSRSIVRLWSVRSRNRQQRVRNE